MAKKARKKAKKASPKSTGKKFSMKALHTELDKTKARLQKEKKTKKRDQLIAMVTALRIGTPCPQQMLIDLGI